tara:strand:+ start:120 stop:500 length:381 start_codon:yes stop_codon:yes gene_type:complete
MPEPSEFNHETKRLSVSLFEEQQSVAPSIEILDTLPLDTQLLLAYCLSRNTKDLTLLKSDSIGDPLVGQKWLVPLFCPTRAVSCFRIKPQVWHELRLLSSFFLQIELVSKLEGFIGRKSAEYPWNW